MVGRTALLAGAERAAHLLWDQPPWVLEDPFALLWFPSEVGSLLAERSHRANDPMVRAIRAAVAWRARCVEDALEEALASGIRQYAIVGAGLDSFAWRRAALLPTLRVFEVDAPATQAWKRSRLAKLGVSVPDGLCYVPLDLGRAGVDDGLLANGWDATRPGFLSWIAVTMYLSREAVASTLNRVSRLAPGTRLALTYIPPEDSLGPSDRQILRQFRKQTDAAGEPLCALYKPDEIDTLLASAGLGAVRHLDARLSPYFSERSDDLRPHGVERMVVATVGCEADR